MPPRHAGGSEGQLRPSSSSSWAKLEAAGGWGGEDTSPPAPALLPPAPPGAPSPAPQTSPASDKTTTPKTRHQSWQQPPQPPPRGQNPAARRCLNPPQPQIGSIPSGLRPLPKFSSRGARCPQGAAARTRLSRQPPRSLPRSSWTLGSRHEPGSRQGASERARGSCWLPRRGSPTSLFLSEKRNHFLNVGVGGARSCSAAALPLPAPRPLRRTWTWLAATLPPRDAPGDADPGDPTSCQSPPVGRSAWQWRTGRFGARQDLAVLGAGSCIPLGAAGPRRWHRAPTPPLHPFIFSPVSGPADFNPVLRETPN